MSSKIDLFSSLPPEINRLILSYLYVQDLGRICRLNQKWKQLGSDNRIWMAKFPTLIQQIQDLASATDSHPANLERKWDPIFPTLTEGKSIKEFLDQRGVNFYSDLLKKVQLFLYQKPLSPNRDFVCLFPLRPECNFR